MTEGRLLKLFKLLQKMKSIRVILWASFAVGAVLSVIAQVHSEDESSATLVVLVSRRKMFDMYTILQQNNTELMSLNCDNENATYVVKEDQCISNHQLFNGNLNYRLYSETSLLRIHLFGTT